MTHRQRRKSKENIDKPPDQLYRESFEARGYVFRPTTDNWAPNFPGDMVAVSPVLSLRDGKFRVCCWGADDLGMEIDLATKIEALALLKSLPVIITMADLKSRGFKLA